MTSLRPGPDPDGQAGQRARVDPARADELIVVDDPARRVRWPIDLLRFLFAVLGIVALAGVGLLARATAAGVEIDAVGAGRRLPHAVLSLLAVAATLALLLLPVALAIRQLSRRQFRQLAEAVVTALAAILVVALANTALRTGTAAQLYHAIAASGPGSAVPGAGPAPLAASSASVVPTGRSWASAIVSAPTRVSARRRGVRTPASSAA